MPKPSLMWYVAYYPARIIDHLYPRLPNWRPLDSLISRWLFYRAHGRFPNLAHPTAFNELLLRSKLSDTQDVLRSFITDKVYVKDFIASRIGREYVVPTLAVFAGVPAYEEVVGFDTAVIKPTHLSGEIFFAERMDRATYEAFLLRAKSWLTNNHARVTRERNYRKLQPRIMVEPKLAGEAGASAPNDYKIFCFRGRPRLIQVDVSRSVRHQRVMLDLGFRPLPTELAHPKAEVMPREPVRLGEMLSLSSALSREFEFLRVDWYALEDGRLYVGELTSFPGNCGEHFTNGYDEVVGGWWLE